MAAEKLSEETSKNVIRQVEFYFSDSNLPRDNFLKNAINENEDGMVSLALICSFARMRNHLGLGGVKPEEVPDNVVFAVSETLKASSSLKVSDDGKKVGRSTKMLNPETLIEQVDSRTIAVSPLEYNASLKNVETFFAQYGKVNSVRLPRHVADKRCFCGTALVEFSSEEDAEKVLKQNLFYGGLELELKPKMDYDTERERMAEEIETKKASPGWNSRPHSHVNESYPKGLIIAFKLQPVLKEEFGGDEGGQQESENNTDSVKIENLLAPVENVSNNVEKHSDSCENKNGDSVLNEKQKVTQDGVEVNDKNVSKDVIPESDKKDAVAGEAPGKKDAGTEETPSNLEANVGEKPILREDLKSIFQRFGTVKYVDYSMGQNSGYIRFEEPEAGQKARAAAALADNGGLLVQNCIAVLEPVTGDAEEEYWSLLRGKMDRFHQSRGGWTNNRRGRVRHFGGKHPRPEAFDVSDEPSKKAQKVEVD